MGKRRRGGGGGGGGGGRGGGGDDDEGGGGGGGRCDQYGEGWSGGHRDDFSRGQGGGKPGRGGGQAGGSSAPQVAYTRHLPKFLQGFGDIMATRVDEEAPLVEDYSGAQRRLADIGDEEDVADASRAGLGSRRQGDQHAAPAPEGAQFAGLDGDTLGAEQEAALRLQLANENKAKGNRAFSEGRHEDAVRHFSACIAIDASNHIYFSNRSAAHAALCQWEAARRDALKTTALAPDWPKGWARLGSAAMGCEAFTDATEAYARAIQLDPDNEQYRQSKQAAEEAEAKALAAGKFKFHKVEGGSAPKRSKAAHVPAVAGVRNPTLLSFDAEDDNGDE